MESTTIGERRSGHRGGARRALGLLGAAAAALLGFAAEASAQTSLPTYVSTPSGWMHTEDRYVPGVTQAELGWFATPRGATEAVKAQSIAARTFLLRYLNNNGQTATIPALGPSFQAWTSGISSGTLAASRATRGQVLTYQGTVIYANYASGAWPLDGNGEPFAPSRYGYGSLSWSQIRQLFLTRNGSGASAWTSQVWNKNSWAWTQVLTTNNEGRSGASVTPTIHASTGVRNRGSMGQYRATWLDESRGYGYQRILRAAYGEDVTIVGAPSSGSPAGGSTSASTGSSSSFSSGGGATSGAADLVVTSLSVANASGDATYVGVGHDVSFRATIANQGGPMSGTLPVRVSYYAGGALVGTGIATVRLGAGQSASVGFDTAAWRPSTPGAYSVEARVNDDARVPEASRGNNSRAATVRVFQPLRISASALNVRGGPGTGYGAIGLVRSGDVVVARARSGDFYQIDFSEGTSAWVHGGYVAAAGRVSAVRIVAGSLNVRSGPSTGYARLGSAGAGQLFASQGSQSGWSKVWWGGSSGWVAAFDASYSVPLGL